jgi:hypothetical protein
LPVLAPNFTVDDLVSSVKVRAMLPTNASTLSSTDIIRLLDEEMRSKVMPIVKALKEEFWVTSTDYAVSSGTTSYAIPYRAMGWALRDIVFVDGNGNELKLIRYEPEDIKFPLRPIGSPLFQFGYYLKDNSIILYPTVLANYSTYSLRMKYERRPNNLVSITACSPVTVIAGNKVTVASAPATFGATATYDVINHLPPFNSLGDDCALTTFSGNDLTFSTLPTGIAVGNWVCLSMQTPVPQLPYESFPILAQCATVRALASTGDQDAMGEAKMELSEMVSRFNDMMTPRVEGTPKTLTGRNNIFNYGRNTVGNLGTF